MGPPSLPPTAFVFVPVLGSCVWTGAGLGVVQIITSGERALTGQTLLPEISRRRGDAFGDSPCLAHERVSGLLPPRDKCHGGTH